MVMHLDVNVVPEQGLLSTISSLEAEMLQLRSKQSHLHTKRRAALDKMLDIKGSIRVFCRVRPAENRKRRRSHISIDKEKIAVKSVGAGRKEFIADRVFVEDSSQEEIFGELQPILRSALDGHNVCVFAYGQTGTGKTYTMEGATEQPGIVPRAIEVIFHQVTLEKTATFTLSISMLEVYMGNLRDLLTQRQSSARGFHSVPKCNLSIMSGSKGGLEIDGLRDVELENSEQAIRWYAKGKRARSTSWTNVNEASSRSHCLTRITIRRSAQHSQAISKLWLVDLGGSERLMKTGASGVTMDEGRAINLSLSALGDVIAALKLNRTHIPYRNSKLTQILSDSLGHGSKVLMIVHISPDEDDIAETICSLSFAKRVRAVEASRELSEESKKQKQESLGVLEKIIEEADEELSKVRKQIDRAEEMIQEKTKFLRVAYGLADDGFQKGSPRSSLILNHAEEAMESPQITEKSNDRVLVCGSVPHFMASTMSSRQRQHSAESFSKGKVGSRKPIIDSLTPQESMSNSPRVYLKSNSSIMSKRKKVMTEADIAKKRDCLSEHNAAVSVSQGSSISSKPTFPLRHATWNQHKRRMSDLT